jgi:WD40 repeat protein
MSITRKTVVADAAIDVDAADEDEAAERALILAREDGRFASLAAFRLAHSRLLAAQDEARGGVEPIARRAEELLDLGAATGAVLDENQDRWEAQGLLDYWYNALYRAGRRPRRPRLIPFDAKELPSLEGVRCPYLGLSAFSEDDSDLFFGRQALLEAIVHRLGEVSMLAVVGASGSGKSSIVRAGLIPALRSGRLLHGSASWSILPIVLPGSTPLENLARAAIRAEAPDGAPPDPAAGAPAGGDLVPELAAAMRRDPGALAARLDRPGGSPVVLIIDQFEEIFTLCDDKEAVEATFGNLLGLIRAGAGAGPKHRIVLTMRIDFEVYVLKYPEFRREFERGRVAITPLERDELREAIERPARAVGLKFERGVVDKLIEDTYGEPGALPLLQFTLMRLWHDRRRNKVAMEAYTRLGGARLALATVADAVFADLKLVQNEDAAKRIFLRIVRPGTGLEVTNRRLREQDLFPEKEDHTRTRAVLERLIAEGLIRRTHGLGEQDTQVEVAHEALVRNWPRLVDWLNDERAAIVARQGWEDKVAEWIHRGREALLDEAQIKDAEEWLDPRNARALLLGAIPDLPALVGASRDEIRRRREELASSRRYAVIAGIITAVFLVLALASMLWYQATWMLVAIPKGLASEVTRLRAARPDAVELRTLLAAEVVRRTPGRLTEEARQGLIDSVTQLPPVARTFPAPDGVPVAMAVSPDGKSLALATDRRRVALYRTEDWGGAWTKAWDQPVDDAVFSLAFSPRGDRLMAAAPDQAAVARIARAAARALAFPQFAGSLVDSLSFPPQLSARINGPDQPSAPGGGTVSSVLVFDVEPQRTTAPRPVRVRTKTPPAFAMTSPDGRWLYYAAWNNALWRADASHLGAAFPFEKVWPAPSPLGPQPYGLATAQFGRQPTDSADDAARPETGRVPGLLGFSPDGRFFTYQNPMAPGPDNSDASTSLHFFTLDPIGTRFVTPPLLPDSTPNPGVSAIAQLEPDLIFSPRGELCAVTMRRSFQLWPLAPSAMRGNPSSYSPSLSESARVLAVSPGGDYVATVADAVAEQQAVNASSDLIRPGPTMQVVDPMTGGIRQVGALGRIQVLAGGATSVHIVERWSGRVVARATHDAAITAAQFSPDGHRLATTARDGSVKVWAMRWGVTTPRDLDAGFCQIAAFAPDGSRLALASGPATLPATVAPAAEPAAPTADATAEIQKPRWDVRLLDLNGGGAEGAQEPLLSSTTPVQAVRISPGAGYLIATSVPLVPTYSLPTVNVRRQDTLPVAYAYSPPPQFPTTSPEASRFAVHWIDLGTGEHHSIDEVGPIAAADIRPDGERLATSAWRSRMTLFDLAGPAAESVPFDHPGPMAAALSPSGDRVATVGWDNAVRIWRRAGRSMEPSAPIDNPGLVRAPTFSSDGNRLAYVIHSSQPTSPTAVQNTTVKVVDVTGRGPTAVEFRVPGPNAGLTLNHDGSLIGIMTDQGAAVGEVRTGRLLYQFKNLLDRFPIRYDPVTRHLVDPPIAVPVPDVGPRDQVEFWGRHIEFSPDGRLLAIAAAGELGILDTRSGDMLGILESGGVAAVRFSDRGSFLAMPSADGKGIGIRHLPDLETTASIPATTTSMELVRFEPDGGALRVAESDSVYRFPFRRPGPTPVGSADRPGWSAIRTRLIRLSHFLDTIRVNDPAATTAPKTSQKSVFPPPARRRPNDDEKAEVLEHYLLDPTGPRDRDPLLRAAGIAAGAATDRDRQLLIALIKEVVRTRPEEVPRGNPIFQVPPDFEGYQPWALSPDGLFLTLASEMALCRFDLESRAPQARPKEKPSELSTWLVSDDGRVGLALAVAATTTVRDARGEQARTVLDGEPVYALAYNPDGSLLATGSLDKHLRLFDAETLAEVFHPKEPHPAPIRGVAFSPSGARLATIAADQVVRIWSLERMTDATAPRFLTRIEMPSPVHRVAFSHDNRYFAAAGGDFTLRVWDLTTKPDDSSPPRPVAFPRDQLDLAIAFAPGDDMLVALPLPLSYSGTLKTRLDFLPWSKPALLKLAGQRVSRNLDRTEWETYLAGLPYRTTIPSREASGDVTWRMVPNRGWQVPLVLLLAAGVVALFLLVVPARVPRHWMDHNKWVAYAIALLAAGAVWGWLTPPMVWTDVLSVPSLIEKLTVVATLGVLALLCIWGQPKLIARYSPIETERPLEALVAWWWQVANPWLAARLDSPDDPPLGGSGRV